jgi:hypothetical protein
MARTFSLAAYAVKVWDVEERSAEQIADFGQGSDLLDFFKQFLTDLKTNTINDDKVHQVLRVTILKSGARRLYGVIETGEYGAESELYDVKKRQIAHRRKTTEADMLPFYFLVDLPEGVDEGILLLQRQGMFGIRKLFHHAIGQVFDGKFPGYVLRFLPLVENKEIQKYAKGKIESIRFIRFGIPRDVADAYDSGHKETRGSVELVIRARRGSNLPLNSRLRQFLRGGKEIKDLIALDELNFKYENVKVKSRVGTSTRTLDLSRPNRLRSYYDISGRVELDPKTGHPEFDSIRALSEEILEQIRSTIYKE